MLYGGAAAALAVLVELGCYTLWIPAVTRRPPRANAVERWLGSAAYLSAYALSLLRAPLGLLPYLVKLFISLVLHGPYLATRGSYRREALNLAGDVANLGLSTALVARLAGPPRAAPLQLLLYAPLGAELVRLLAERTPMLFSTAWHLLPHRTFAR